MGSSIAAMVVSLLGGALAAVVASAIPLRPAASDQIDRPASSLGLLAAPIRIVACRLERVLPERLWMVIDPLRVRAGEPGGLGSSEHLALCVLACTAGTLMAVPLADALGTVGIGAVAASAAALPLVRLSGQARRRLGSIDRSLARANDLLVLSLEAGLDLVGALRLVVSKAQPDRDPLTGEFTRILKDLELGSTRRAAMEAFAARAPTDAVKGFVAGVVQAEQRGTPLARALRIQSVALRTARSQRIEARASRASVLVLFPLLLIFAATVLLVFGGVVVRAMRGELL